MGVLSITEIINTVKKHFLRILAFSLALAFIGGYVTNLLQTYTCTLGFQYNYEQAAEGIAPDGVSKLDPYEIQNPVVIQAALRDMGLTNVSDSDVKGIRENIAISPIITNLDKEVSDSAALLGEKYDVFATEYEVSFTYSASRGDAFGTKMFSNIINEYDEFLLSKYYNKTSVDDFAKVISDTNAEYIVIADSISNSLESIIAYLDQMASDYPDFRSTTTGYSFGELSLLYQNLRDIQYAKYYGNVRAGNLANDSEMVIKSYKKKIKDLQEDADVNYSVSENYKKEITSFYDSYKAAGLYKQAEQVQRNVDSSNNRDQDVLEDSKLEEFTNTYDDIILSYTDHAGNMTDAVHTIAYYNMIIDSYTNDTVPEGTKSELIDKNKEILSEITHLSTVYSDLSCRTIDELYDSKISNDLQYLILPEVNEDKPIMLIVIFLFILGMGLSIIFTLIWGFLKNSAKAKSTENEEKVKVTDDKIAIDTAGMDELHKALYDQYMEDFSEFYLAYQPMISNNKDTKPHMEVFIRWESPKLGKVSPGKIIGCLSDFNIFTQFNDWLIKQVCEDLASMKEKKETLPVVHINCPYSELEDFALNDIIIKHIKHYNIPTRNLCFELDGKNIANSLEDILLLTEMGIRICIDRFEDSEEETEIINVLKPGYIKMSLDVLNTFNKNESADENVMAAATTMIGYISGVIEKCRKNGIKTCICGIEKEAQDKFVTNLGFDYKQGYYYGKPEKLEKTEPVGRTHK